MSEQQKDVDQQDELKRIFFPILITSLRKKWSVMKKRFYRIFDVEEEERGKRLKKEGPILCKPYLVTIKAIYHEYYGRHGSYHFSFSNR